MHIPLQDLKAEFRPIKAEVLGAIERVLDNMTLYQGPNQLAFEEEMASYLGVKHAIGVSSGTDALLVAYLALGVKAGDEIIVPSHTFIATVAPLAFLGAKPVFVDIDPDTCNMDPAAVERAITPRTRGIVAVHLYGQSVEMDPIMECAKAHGLWVTEDVAQSVGSDYKGTKLGAIGDVGCFSFVFTKNLRAYGNAGMVTTNNDDIAFRMRRLRDHGRSDKYTHPTHGLNARMDEIPAAILHIQFRHLEDRLERRRANAAYFTERLTGSGLITPTERATSRHTYHLYVVRAADRDGLQAHLLAAGIQTGIHYPIPCHLQEACAASSAGPGSLPVTERVAREILTLPVYPELSAEQRQYIVESALAWATVRS